MFEWQKVFSRILGLAFGWGTRRIVEGAYRFLAAQYQDGDEIFIFGFSRGAYAARCLAALIRAVGLIRGHETHLFDYAWTLLLSRDKKSGKPDFKLLAKFKATFGRPVSVRYLGLYDTVKSIGAMPPFGRPRPRNIPADAAIHHSVRSRLDSSPEYRPVNLPEDCPHIHDAPLAWELAFGAANMSKGY